ncbi:MAG TPA: DUF1338 domain-containing protein [Bacteroidales bacterium]|nr:DUF1338 domain-containing protein [Bacteroidales bacterium]
MELNDIFSRLWTGYSTENPSADKVSNLLKNEGEEVINDHIAFRTLDVPEISIDIVATPFIKNGYVQGGEYFFEDKHLFAKHYELPNDNSAPRVFISQLVLHDCSPFVREVFREAMLRVDLTKIDPELLIFKGQLFKPISYNIYRMLREESEYAAWFYVFGLRVNHFTVSVNALKKHNTIFKVNELLKKNGFSLNSSGGEVKGTPEELLQQSSTMADLVKVRFEEGFYEIPSCYYEFAQRYKDSEGRLYKGFIAKSADKIFESTDSMRR